LSIGYYAGPLGCSLIQMIYITEVRMDPPGTEHGHVAAVKWEMRESPEAGESTREEMVDWIGNKEGFAHVRDEAGNEVEVRVVRPKEAQPYLRTYPLDGIPSDNLLSLPRY
jgi:hypothetical protein